MTLPSPFMSRIRFAGPPPSWTEPEGPIRSKIACWTFPATSAGSTVPSVSVSVAAVIWEARLGERDHDALVEGVDDAGAGVERLADERQLHVLGRARERALEVVEQLRQQLDQEGEVERVAVDRRLEQGDRGTGRRGARRRGRQRLDVAGEDDVAEEGRRRRDPEVGDETGVVVRAGCGRAAAVLVDAVEGRREAAVAGEEAVAAGEVVRAVARNAVVVAPLEGELGSDLGLADSGDRITARRDPCPRSPRRDSPSRGPMPALRLIGSTAARPSSSRLVVSTIVGTGIPSFSGMPISSVAFAL